MRSTARSTSATRERSASRWSRGATSRRTRPSRVVIVDENLADKYWPGGNALGQRLRTRAPIAPDRWYTVVGVVPAVKQASLAETPIKETVYWHYEQRPRPRPRSRCARWCRRPSSRAPSSAAIAALDPEVALYDTQTMDDRVSSSLGPQRTPMVLTLVFAGVAFVLAVIGIYGVLAWAVASASARSACAWRSARAPRTSAA